MNIRNRRLELFNYLKISKINENNVSYIVRRMNKEIPVRRMFTRYFEEIQQIGSKEEKELCKLIISSAVRQRKK